MMHIGDKIEVIKLNGLGKIQNPYFSMVQDIPIDNEVIITLPIAAGRPISLTIGQKVQVIFFRETGQFYFVAKVTHRQRTETMHLIRLKQISPIHRLQRRNFYRLKIVLPLFFRVAKNNQEHKSPYSKGYTVDISGGGMRIITDKPLKPGMYLECRIPIKEEGEITIKGLVKRVGKEVDKEYKFNVAIQFVGISENIRDKIIYFIFEEQRKLRRKN